MRPRGYTPRTALIALLPILCTAAALVLSFLCLFAGQKKGLMEDYNIMTLNTSRLGVALFEKSSNSRRSSPIAPRLSLLSEASDIHHLRPSPTIHKNDLIDDASSAVHSAISSVTTRLPSVPDLSSSISNFFHSLPGDIESFVQSLPDNLDNLDDKLRAELAEKIAEMRDRLGIQDFYSAHIMSTCQGQYTPLEVANGTVRQKDIHKNVTKCDKTHDFNATRIVENALNNTHTSIGLGELKWPSAIEDGIKTINKLLRALQILYIVSCSLVGAALLVPLFIIVFWHPGRLSVIINTVLAASACGFMLITSALVNTMVNTGSGAINRVGNKIGVVAYKGHGFLAMTWAATALMGVAMVTWIVLFCVGRKERKGKRMEIDEGREIELKQKQQQHGWVKRLGISKPQRQYS